MRISMIVAHGPKREIGFDNKLLWHIKEDLQHFKKITTGKIILMGRKTFQSIGKALPDRLNIILTHDTSFSHPGVEVIHDPEMLFDLVLEKECEQGEDGDVLEVVVCGGEEVYKLYLPYAVTIYRTLVDFQGLADTFFPELDMSEWEITSEEKNTNLIFQTLTRK